MGMRGWIVDGDYGLDIAKYTGSTTGTTRNNEICSRYTPITWQVDRKCHLISASSFDKMCADMKAQRDDMSKDLYAHVLVSLSTTRSRPTTTSAASRCSWCAFPKLRGLFSASGWASWVGIRIGSRRSRYISELRTQLRGCPLRVCAKVLAW